PDMTAMTDSRPGRDGGYTLLELLTVIAVVAVAAALAYPGIAGLSRGPGSFPVAERAAANCVSLPIFPELTDEQVDQILASPNAAAIDEIFTYAAVGTPATVAERINNFASATRVDEVITSHYADTTAARVRSLELTAAAVGLAEMSNA
ncbi:MAG: hypothetical protein RLZZ371_1789, partial [Pseudomonadota bacterium]